MDIAARSFLRNSRKYRLGSLRKTPHGSHTPIGPGPTSGRLAFNLQPTIYSKIFLKNFYPTLLPLTRNSILNIVERHLEYFYIEKLLTEKVNSGKSETGWKLNNFGSCCIVNCEIFNQNLMSSYHFYFWRKILFRIMLPCFENWTMLILWNHKILLSKITQCCEKKKKKTIFLKFCISVPESNWKQM